MLPEKAVPEITYISTVSGGTLNPTHSLTPCGTSLLYQFSADKFRVCITVALL